MFFFLENDDEFVIFYFLMIVHSLFRKLFIQNTMIINRNRF